MNFQTAAIVGAASGGLSFLAGLIGGVPFLDIVIRAIFWGAFGFGGALGIEALLRSLVPDLFLSASGTTNPEEAPRERAVDIVLDEEPLPPRTGFIEEVDEDDQPQPSMGPRPTGEAVAPSRETQDDSSAEPLPMAAGEEDMPEIGAFLDAFKPSSEEGAEQGEISSGGYAPAEPEYRSSQEVTMDGEEQDPVILAKAVQTIMKRDA